MVYDTHLRAAVKSLSPTIRSWLRRALDSGWYPIGAGNYNGGPGEAMCPVAAAATMAGIWSDGGIVDGYPEWGTPQEPSPAVEDFAAYFDLFSSEAGIKAAVETVRRTLQEDRIANAA